MSWHAQLFAIGVVAASSASGPFFATEAAASSFFCSESPQCVRLLDRSDSGGAMTSNAFGLFEPNWPEPVGPPPPGRLGYGSATSSLSATQLTVSVPLPGSAAITARCESCNSLSAAARFAFSIPLEITEPTKVVWSTSAFQIGSYVTSNPLSFAPSLSLELSLQRSSTIHDLLDVFHQSGSPVPPAGGEFVLEPGGGTWTLIGEIRAGSGFNNVGTGNLELISNVAGSVVVSLVPVSGPAPKVPAMGALGRAVLALMIIGPGTLPLIRKAPR